MTHTPDIQKKLVQFLGDSEEESSAAEDDETVAPIDKGKGIDPSERPQMPTDEGEDADAEDDIVDEDAGDDEDEDDEDEGDEDDEDGVDDDVHAGMAVLCLFNILSDFMLQIHQENIFGWEVAFLSKILKMLLSSESKLMASLKIMP